MIDNISIGIVHDWHQPLNESCEHNQNILRNCTCKRKRNRKPFRVVRVHDELTKDRSHKTKQDIIIEIHQTTGRLVFRELGKRTRYETTIIKVYEGLRWRAAMVAAQQARANRKNRKGGKR